MGKVYGNTESVRKALLDYMESFIDNVYEPGAFLPGEILEMMKLATIATKREIAVFLDRRNRVISVGLGDASSASLEGYDDLRRGEKRLCGVRLWHTHPNGSVSPSDVDINSLIATRLDACGVIGVNAEGEYLTGLSATVLHHSDEGELCEHTVYGPIKPSQYRVFDALFEEIRKIDGDAGQFSSESVKSDKEKAILIGLILPENENEKWSDAPLSELRELAKTAGAEVVGSFVQKRPAPDSRYYIGKGLAQELSLKAQALGATLIIADDEITASTVKNLEELIGVRVIDRTTLILDIFALRAKSREGKLQVELAQQKYRLPRLMGQGTKLSRLGGGIGTRGPGESKLTVDRNHIRRRIGYLEDELRKVEQNRAVARKEREKHDVPVAAVVGYTNAGKSTLINALCDSDVFAEDMLFATLDPSVRKLTTDDNKDFLLVDTVGFIKKLPHELVNAFKSTLEELKYADLLIHVVDGSSPYASDQIRVVRELIEELGAGFKPQYVVVNKIDKLENPELAHDNTGVIDYKTFYTSAAEGTGLPELKDAIVKFFTPKEVKFHLIVPYSDGACASYLHTNGKVESAEYTENGVEIVGKIEEKLWKKSFEDYNKEE